MRKWQIAVTKDKKAIKTEEVGNKCKMHLYARQVQYDVIIQTYIILLNCYYTNNTFVTSVCFVSIYQMFFQWLFCNDINHMG